ncbi:MAG: hypothetical protein DI565_14020 [Ancylobacter novellus]|uniref:Uncharacterized protein n=1 Tax=Ancylobacter novellus TaxID=921 RepID=A0A2W5KD88_ANCNO|nr:MAG: hypothetical protein DI565_14020 [Ancylobacter novellus]
MLDVDRIDRDIRELVQAVATLEVVVARIAGSKLAFRGRLACELRHLADDAVYQRDGLDPAMLDRIARHLGDQIPEIIDLAKEAHGRDASD